MPSSRALTPKPFVVKSIKIYLKIESTASKHREIIIEMLSHRDLEQILAALGGSSFPLQNFSHSLNLVSYGIV